MTAPTDTAPTASAMIQATVAWLSVRDAPCATRSGPRRPMSPDPAFLVSSIDVVRNCAGTESGPLSLRLHFRNPLADGTGIFPVSTVGYWPSADTRARRARLAGRAGSGPLSIQLATVISLSMNSLRVPG